MDNIQLLLTILTTVLFCLGWNIVTSENNLLYFIRKPFEKAIDNIEMYNDRLNMLSKFSNDTLHAVSWLKKTILINKIIFYIGKPFVLCITCYASIWGVVIYITLNGLSMSSIPFIIINCVSASFLQTFIYKLYAKLD
jgi:hypothetical protein